MFFRQPTVTDNLCFKESWNIDTDTCSDDERDDSDEVKAEVVDVVLSILIWVVDCYTSE